MSDIYVNKIYELLVNSEYGNVSTNMEYRGVGKFEECGGIYLPIESDRKLPYLTLNDVLEEMLERGLTSPAVWKGEIVLGDYTPVLEKNSNIMLD